MEKICQFLKDAGTYYLATAEGDQPRVRPFGTAHIFENKLYIQTGKVKPVAKQILANPKVELCAFKDGVWLRVAGELALDDRVEAKKSMLEKSPEALPTMLRYDTFYNKNSLYNTPPAFCIYMVGKTAKWIKAQGGLAAGLGLRHGMLETNALVGFNWMLR